MHQFQKECAEAVGKATNPYGYNPNQQSDPSSYNGYDYGPPQEMPMYSQGPQMGEGATPPKPPGMEHFSEEELAAFG
jgi:hypothetical protein